MALFMELTPAGVLAAGKWFTKEQADALPAQRQRSELISALARITCQPPEWFQQFDDTALVGKLGTAVLLREIGIRSEDTLKTMEDKDHRNSLIVENSVHCGGILVPYLQAMNDRDLVRLGLEWAATSGSKTYNSNGKTDALPMLFADTRPILEPDDSFYLRSAVHLNPIASTPFNTIENPSTRTITLTGVRLVFAPGDRYRQQTSFQGEDVIDLKALEIRADQVVIRMALRFPGTNVTIHARELIFEGAGSIDTTPVGYGSLRATSPNHTDDGYPADEDGNPNYRTADGRNGEKAGDIHLYVRSISDPGPGTLRFICRGSDGQLAEEGGLRLYQPKRSDQPAGGKDLNAVTAQSIRQHLKDLADVEEKREDWWRWPDGTSGSGVSSLDSIALENDALKQANIVHLKLTLHNRSAYTCRARRTFFPSLDTKRTLGCEFLVPVGPIPNPLRIGCVAGELSKYSDESDNTRQRPGDGRDAYPSGKPGDGGNGGAVVSHLTVVPIDPKICDVGGGKPGADTAAVSGEEPGKPYPAYWANIYAIQKDTIAQAPENPTVELTNVSAKKGADAEAKKGASGKDGSVGVATSPSDWLHPEALGPVIGYARDVYRNGHRDTAREKLEPYFFELVRQQIIGVSSQLEMPLDLSGKLNEIRAIRTNLDNNVDYYGNPPGWLPRLDVKTNYNIWDLFSTRAAKVLHFARKMEHDWDRIEDRQKAISETSTALLQEWEATQKALADAYKELKSSREALDEIQTKVLDKRRDIEDLRKQAAAKAKAKLDEQRIFTGVMKIVAGLAESIPVGQPYLGLAGKTLSSVGEFDLNDPNVSGQIGTLFSKFSEHAGTFLQENEAGLIDSAGGLVPKPQGSKANLKAQIDAAKGSLEEFDKSSKSRRGEIDKAIKKEWDDVTLAQKKAITARIAEIDLSMPSLTGTKKKRKEGERSELTAFETELAATVRLKHQKAKAKLYDELSSLNKNVNSRATEKVKLRQELLSKLETAQKQRSTFEKETAKYEKDKVAAEESTASLLSGLSGLSDGIGHIGESIAAFTAPYDENEVDRQAQLILKGSELSEPYTKLIGEMKELAGQKAQAASAFCANLQIVNTHSARLVSAALETKALANHRQAADSVLDPGMKDYLRGMQNRAADIILWSQYHFVKSWQYEYLQDVPDGFYDADQWTNRLAAFETKKSGLDNKKPTEFTDEDWDKLADTFLDEQDFLKIRTEVLDAHILDMLKRVLNEREKQQPPTENKFECILKEEQRQQLRTEGSVTVNLIRDLKKGSARDINCKIGDINLEVFELETEDEGRSVNIDFVHSGDSVLLRSDGTYYKFAKAASDSAISWGFIYNHADYLRLKAETDDVWTYTGKSPLTKDKLSGQSDLNFITERFGDAIKYKEYSPAFSSDITLWLNRGQSGGGDAYRKFLSEITDLKKVQFTVTYIKSGTLSS